MDLPKTTKWQLVYHDWNPEQQQLREALCTLGNGRFATRGAFAGAQTDGVHYHGTYMGGVYNRRTSQVAGRDIENEDLVNLPNWLCLNFKPEDGEWLDFNQVEWLDFKQALDVRHGILTYRLHFRDRENRETRLFTRRIVHMADSHLAALQWQLQPVNWEGEIIVRSALDGRVENLGVERYRKLATKHLETLEARPCGSDSLLLCSATNQSRLQLAQTIRTRILINDGRREPPEFSRQIVKEPGYIAHQLQLPCRQGETVRIEKVATLFSGRDRAICEPALEAENAAARAGDFESLLKTHRKAWNRYWHCCDIELKNQGGQREPLILRLHVFHMLQTTSLHTIDLDVGVPARGLHGEAYRGHIFWDELFIFPLLNLRLPQITRALLLYRCRRLPEARRAARREGLRGAMFPWQSGSNGREESQVVHLNPKSGNWVPDHTYKQRHINAAIVHNVWRYFQVTGDTEFMAFAGAEMILSIAMFWASAATYSKEKKRYAICNVAGPDEFHTGYPGRREPGLDNNAYTNIMASWCLQVARQSLELLCPIRRRDLLQTLNLDEREIEKWNEISRKMYVPFHGNGIISQFEGYEKLEELDWPAYRKKYGDIHRLDRILEKEGDDINRYKASKQADVLMLFYLFSAEKIQELFNHLGYEFQPEMIPRNLEYYQRRTSHGSTLSGIVHSWVLARSDREQSWDLFGKALMSDVADVQGGTTGEGIHLGAMAGTVDLVLRCYSGLELRGDILWLNPCLPEELREVRQKIHYRGHWLTITANHQRLLVEAEEAPCPPVRIGFRNRVFKIGQGQSKEFKY